MNLTKQDILHSLKQLKANSKKRKFVQSLDLTINFKGLDFKKPESKIDVSVKLPFYDRKAGASKTLVFIEDKDFAQAIKPKASKIIMLNDIPAISKAEAEKLMAEYDIFVAQGPAMLAVAKHLGQILAPKGRMPKLITTNVSSFEQEILTSSTVVRISNKKGKNMSFIHLKVGKESDDDEKLAENIFTAFNAVLNALPTKEQNISSALVKLTMSPPIKIGGKEAEAK